MGGGRLGRESFAYELDLSVVSREEGDFRKVSNASAAITASIRDARNCLRKRIVRMRACVSVGWGEGGGCFLFRFSGEENRSSRETGPRPKEAAVPCMNAHSHPARYSTLSTSPPLLVDRLRVLRQGGETRRREGNACCITPPAFRRRSTDAPLRSHHSRSLPLSPSEQTLANYIRR